jgi:hypothetical protein
MTKQLNARLPELSHDQIDELCEEYGLTKTQILILAIDRLHRDLLPDEFRMGELTTTELALIKTAKDLT